MKTPPILILVLIIICIFTIGYSQTPDTINTKAYVTIEAHNGYKLQVSALVKCDWDNKMGNFKFIKEYILRPKETREIKIGKQYNNCQLWPRIMWFGK